MKNERLSSIVDETVTTLNQSTFSREEYLKRYDEKYDEKRITDIVEFNRSESELYAKHLLSEVLEKLLSEGFINIPND